MWQIQLFKLNYNELEVKAASKVIQSGWLSMGEETINFEESFSSFLGKDVYCKAVSNGTAALHMALLALDIGHGDEVIIPSLTFVADVNTVNIVGASPVLADACSLDDWNMSLETIKEKVTDKTKAIIIVHYAGYPCKDIKAISKFCNDKGIALIEDVAHAPGASVDGKKCGTFGAIGCFSFFSNKNLSIGEGGMVSTMCPGLHKKLGYLRSHGMTTLTLDRHKGRSITYDVAKPGLNYRMDEMRSAIGSVQLKKLPDGNLRRGELTQRYRSNLSATSVIIPFKENPTNIESVYHILPIMLPEGTNRVSIIGALKDKGIQSSIHYPPFWDFSAFRGQFIKGDSPITAEICSRQLTLPLFPTMTDQEVDQVTSALIEAINDC
ncbi:DegT/DnrJ/EryC1/StrS aminotransferase family protein [Gammaproteobacteria bacterium]|nr:DegT/DnrJ/EryC1/StrS aminotransferase family protein [Gammaproteobacteria bacterium]